MSGAVCDERFRRRFASTLAQLLTPMGLSKRDLPRLQLEEAFERTGNGATSNLERIQL
ncbi:hypothetical protein MCBRY_002430 [Methylocystis bryophila]